MKRLFLIFVVLTSFCLLAFADGAGKDAWMGAAPNAPNAISPGISKITPEYSAAKAARAPHNNLDVTLTSLCNSLVCVQISSFGDFNIGTADGRTLLYYYPSE